MRTVPCWLSSLQLQLLRSLLPCALVLSAAAHAGEGEGHARIADERRALNTQFDAEEQACQQRFVVTACVDDVRLRRRRALAPLRQQELVLADAERRQRVAEREAAVAAKQRAAAARGPASAPTPRKRQPMLPAHTASDPATRLANPDEIDALRHAQAAERARASAQRRADAAAAQDRVAEREARLLAKNKAKGRQPDTLPFPAPAGPTQ